MKLEKPVEIWGKFHFVGTEDPEMAGILRISEFGEITLEAVSDYVESFKSLESVQIVGVLRDGRPITLNDCLRINHQSSSAGLSLVKWQINEALLGIDRTKNSNVKFESIYCRMDGLYEWVCGTTILKINEPIRFGIANDQVLEIGVGYNKSLSGVYASEQVISNFAYVKLTSDCQIELDSLLHQLQLLQGFFSFCLGKNTAFKSIVAYSSSLQQEVISRDFAEAIGWEWQDNMIRNIPIEVYRESKLRTQAKNNSTSSLPLLSLFDISDRVAEIINRWLLFYNKARMVINSYQIAKSGTNNYIDNTFLDLARAIEIFHRVRFPDETMIPVNEFEELKSRIIKNCTGKIRKKVKSKLQRLNDPSLETRVRSMVGMYNEHFENSYANIIANTRNYLTHYPDSLKSKAVKGKELYFICLGLESLIELHLMQEIGLEIAQIKAIIEKHSYLKYKLETCRRVCINRQEV